MRAAGIHEYSRDCRVERALLVRVILLCVLYVLLLAFAMFISILLSSIPAFLIFLVIAFSVFWVTRPFLSEKRDYEIVDGSFRVYKIYGRSLSRRIFECDLQDMTEIAPYDKKDGIQSEFDSLCSYIADSRSTDVYYAIYEKNSARCAVLFDGDDKFRCAAAFYARRAFRPY